MGITDEEMLSELAWRAVATPSVDAPVAFQVLMDAFLERGEIAEPPEPFADSSEAVAESAFFSPFVDEQAWTWAQEATLLPILDRLRLAFRALIDRQPPTEVALVRLYIDQVSARASGVGSATCRSGFAPGYSPGRGDARIAGRAHGRYAFARRSAA